ncbi:MAG: MFS transporter, partial [Pseudomonadales bacterium]|nr:MFS transporter [Pseudomonadales bacterium]
MTISNTVHSPETSEKAPIPFWRLSSFYFAYFAQLGVFVPFWTLYLSDRGFDAKDIGTIMAFMMATRIVGPNVWGWLADKTQRRLIIVRWGITAAVLGFLLVFL